MERDEGENVMVDTLADAPRAIGGGAHRIGPSTQVDRFVVLEVLGEGGMGSVYAAYDTRLDRKVAVKVVRGRRNEPERARERLLREAQAMARLAHPNVVTVLDAGRIDGDVYIALEYVEGTNLRRWLREPRTWRAVVDAFVQAGRGLEAVHEAGLVHRDFKPDNVMMRRDGRVQVADFGLVSIVGARDGSTESRSASPPSREVTDIQLTDVGMRVGTPQYMSPEQHAGDPVDASTDQFAFCVAVWEALYGMRPFSARSSLELAIVVSSGTITPPPRDAAVPRWLEAVLRRGLAVKPEDRWPSMTALLAELARDPVRRRRRWLVAAGVAIALVATAGIAWLGWTRTPSAARCDGAEDHLAEVWNVGRAAALRQTFRASGAGYAESAAARVETMLDRWSHAWVDMHVETCQATVRGEQSEAMLDRRMECLDRRLDEARALLAVFEGGDRQTVAEAVKAVSHLGSLQACADRDALAAATPLPDDPIQRSQIRVLRHDLASVLAHERAGAYRIGHELARRTAAVAAQLDYAPLLGEALVARARLETQNNEPKAAERTLATAFSAAGRAGDDRLVADATVELIAVLLAQARTSEAEAVAVVADATVGRAKDPSIAGDLAIYRARVALARGDLARADDQLRRALDLQQRAFGDEHVDVAETLNLLGGLDERRGQTAAARQHYERASRIVDANLGAAHPASAITRANICHLDFLAGEVASARACQEQVVTTLEAALGATHPTLAWALNDVALIQQAQHDIDGATSRLERALAIWERPSVPGAIDPRAPGSSRAGVVHPDVVWPLVNLGLLALERGDTVRAEAMCRRASRVVEAASGPDHPDLIFPLGCLGQTLIDTAPRDAVATLRRALRLSSLGGEPGEVGTVRFHLARALERAGDHGEALREATAARALLVEAGPTEAPTLADLTAWLAGHRPPGGRAGGARGEARPDPPGDRAGGAGGEARPDPPGDRAGGAGGEARPDP